MADTINHLRWSTGTGEQSYQPVSDDTIPPSRWSGCNLLGWAAMSARAIFSHTDAKESNTKVANPRHGEDKDEDTNEHDDDKIEDTKRPTTQDKRPPKGTTKGGGKGSQSSGTKGRQLQLDSMWMDIPKTKGKVTVAAPPIALGETLNWRPTTRVDIEVTRLDV